MTPKCLLSIFLVFQSLSPAQAFILLPVEAVIGSPTMMYREHMTSSLQSTATSSESLLASDTTSESDQNSKKPSIPDNVILFDGICNFCNTWVDILLRLDRQAKFRFAPLQSNVGQELLVQIGKEADDISSVVLVKNDGRYFDKSLCVLQVLEEVGPLPLTQPLANLARNLIQRNIRDGLYDIVAENRYNLMGKRAECRCSDPTYSDRFLS